VSATAPPTPAPTHATPAAPREDTRTQLRRDLKELARPALVYQAWVLLMLAVFDLVILVLEGFSPETFVILAVLSVATLAGVTIGQGMAIARLRGSFLGCLGVLWLTLSCLITVPLGGLGPLGGILIALLWLTPIFVSGGVWSLASSRALFAAWVPVIYGTGAMFAIVERDDIEAFEAGDKLALWSVSTALILFFTIALLLVYLVSRERHRLHRWRHAPRALLAGSVTEKGAARPRLTMLGWVTLVGAGLALTAGTLLIAPYLFRTGPSDDEGRGEQQQGQGEQQQGRGEQQQGQGEQQEGQSGAERAARAAQAVAQAVCPLLIALLLVAAAGGVLIRPIRRLVIIEYLRAVPFPVAPTTRIRMGWRLIEIGLGDLGIEPDGSIDASELVRRNETLLASIDAELLEHLRAAARVRDRITYGLGIEPGDVLRFAKDAERIFVIATNRVELKREASNVFRDVR